MDGLSIDQIQIFLAVVDQGSFSAAARHLNRAQSAVTYTVRKLEEQVGTALFDRSGYRPALTEAGRALMPRARRIAEDIQIFRLQARGVAGGLEPELSFVLDTMFPMPPFLALLKTFRERYPSIQPRIHVESMGAAVRLILDGTCTLGIIISFAGDGLGLRRVPLLDVELAVVAAPDHPLAQLSGPLTPDVLRDHLQLVLTDRSGLTGHRDHGVYAAETWRLGDLGAKHAMLRAGLGWGSMPLHMVADDLCQGRLVRLATTEWARTAQVPKVPTSVACRSDRPIGPAAQWVMEHLADITTRPPGELKPSASTTQQAALIRPSSAPNAKSAGIKRRG